MTETRASSSPWSRLLHALGRIRVRLLVVNALVLLVPALGLEFARIHERQLLASLERDMTNQAALVRALVERDLVEDVEVGDARHAETLTAAAVHTRTRIRLLDGEGRVVVDSHEKGPPEGPEPAAPSLLRGGTRDVGELLSRRAPLVWPLVPDRAEVREALAGRRGTRTRVRDRQPGVFLFVALPIHDAERVAGVVYAVRSTRPVLVELYRIRSGLARVLVVAFVATALVTLLLAASISRPLEKLSRAAKRVASGEPDVKIPVSGGGEIRELGETFAAMNERLGQRLRYISDFAADVAHEFKSPLTSIRGAAELLGEGAADEPEARARFLRNIELDVARLDRLVSRLLELSRIEASTDAMTAVDLRDLLERVASRSSTPDTPVVVRCEAPASVRGREADLETAILNLVENAVKFSPPGESVDVVVTARSRPARVAIDVRDRGPGVAEAYRERVFDRFFTTDASRDGTGLGLSIVRAVVRAHGGAVRVAAAEGGGATFTVELPV